jgi:hypothetical protein
MRRYICRIVEKSHLRLSLSFDTTMKSYCGRTYYHFECFGSSNAESLGLVPFRVAWSLLLLQMRRFFRKPTRFSFSGSLSWCWCLHMNWSYERLHLSHTFWKSELQTWEVSAYKWLDKDVISNSTDKGTMSRDHSPWGRRGWDTLNCLYSLFLNRICHRIHLTSVSTHASNLLIHSWWSYHIRNDGMVISCEEWWDGYIMWRMMGWLYHMRNDGMVISHEE